MFTGIVEHTGKIFQNENGHLIVGSPWKSSELTLGQSIAVNGCCLTIVLMTDEQIHFQISPESIQKTTFSKLLPQTIVNLERSLTLSSLIDGHLVSGHVDTMAQLTSLRQYGDPACYEMKFEFDSAFATLLIDKGSVAINGISLTVNEVQSNTFKIMCIPHTWQVTNLSQLKVGDFVNIEFDMFAKYVQKWMAQQANLSAHSIGRSL